MLANLMPEV